MNGNPSILGIFVAGEEGFEPSTKVLETHVLPLHHSPIAMQHSYYTRPRRKCQPPNCALSPKITKIEGFAFALRSARSQTKTKAAAALKTAAALRRIAQLPAYAASPIRKPRRSPIPSVFSVRFHRAKRIFALRCGEGAHPRRIFAQAPYYAVSCSSARSAARTAPFPASMPFK